MKRIKRIFLIVSSILLVLVVAFAILNWKTINTILILRKGTVAQKEYDIQIPFEYDLGLIFLNVQIEGNDYRFLLDSGSSNVISKDLAEKLNLQVVSNSDLEDSQNAASEVEFTTIGNIKIGELDYLNTGAAIIDLNASEDIACLKIDGLIGANLMKKSIWKIDYQNKLIQLTNSVDSVKIPSSSKKVPFFTELTGSPIIDVLVDGTEEKNVILDLGSNGGFSLSMETYRALLNDHPSVSQISSYGVSSSVLNDSNELNARFYDVFPEEVSFGEVEVNNLKISFSENEHTSTIGSAFLENFEVILDWSDYELILVKKNELKDSNLHSYGIDYGYTNKSIFIKKIFVNSSAEKAGLNINDKIIKIDDLSFDRVAPSEWCDIIRTDLLEKEKNNIEVTVLRENKEMMFSLTKSNLLDN